MVTVFHAGFKYLKEIPVPYAPEDERELITNNVGQILAKKKKDSNADTSALELEIDQVVYKLYGLTEEEIKIVEGKTD